MKKVSIRFFTSDGKIAVKIGAPCHKTYLTAKKAAENYALHSSMLWWDRTVDQIWRTLPTRYDRLDDYQDRLERRMYKWFLSKGMK